MVDPDSGRLLKTESASPAGDITEVLYEEYREFDGDPIACKFIRRVNGRVEGTVEVVEFKTAEKLPGSLFEH